MLQRSKIIFASGAVALVGMLAGSLVDVSPTPNGATISIGVQPAQAFIKRIGRAFSRAARAVARGVSSAAKAAAARAKAIAQRAAAAAKAAAQRVAAAARAAAAKARQVAQAAARAAKAAAAKVAAAAKAGWNKIKELIRKAGELGKKIARQAAETAKKVANKVKDFAKNALNAAKNLAKKVKDKIVNGIKAFAGKAYNFIKDKAQALVATVITSLTKKIGYTAADVKRIVNPTTGVADRQKIREVVTERLLVQYLRPIIQDKLTELITKALDWIQQFVDPLVSAAIGGLGSIPFAGGAIAAAVHLAYTFGMKFLKSFLAKQLTTLLMTKVINPLVNKGVQALYGLGGVVKTALDALFKRAYGFFESWIKLPTQKVGPPSRPFDPVRGI